MSSDDWGSSRGERDHEPCYCDCDDVPLGTCVEFEELMEIHCVVCCRRPLQWVRAEGVRMVRKHRDPNDTVHMDVAELLCYQRAQRWRESLLALAVVFAFLGY